MDSIYVWFPLTFAFLGFLFSSRPIILGLNELNPFQGLIVYYFIIFITLEVMQYFGLVINGVKMQYTSQAIGQMLIIFAYFIIFDMESGWIQEVVNEARGKKEEKKKTEDTSLGNQKMDCPNIYLQSEDGATYYVISTFIENKEIARYVTFVAVPAILTALGVYLTRGKVSKYWF